ncbi:MAG: leucyl aminopeptidase family protein [Bacteroidetes bacterium]|nr:leucyl aminopeptidase family protein [Bacteroidota bacterium]
MTNIKQVSQHISGENLVLLVNDFNQLPSNILSINELKFIKEKFDQDIKRIDLNHLSNWIFVQLIEEKESKNLTSEQARIAGDKLTVFINENKLADIYVLDYSLNETYALPFSEGMALSNYQFLKYITDQPKKVNTLTDIYIVSKTVSDEQIAHLNIQLEANSITRTFVNEPVSYLTAEKLAEDIKHLLRDTNVNVEVLNKKKIESLKMGGLLAVNKGSIDPPTFCILEYKPENAHNDKPYAFVGKGVVYDTGGLNIKTENHMNNMKCDMAGAATVAGAIYAIAKAKLAVNVVGLIPATDNRLNGNAYVSGDVITMHDGTTVEVINTDAEGRMILADALSYAKKYDPKMVIDLATLTGSAQRAIGKNGSVAMGSKSKNEMNLLKQSGDNVHERIVEFPLWEEYEEELKSTIADIKHLGGSTAGAITAGKFLEHFTDYPYIHLDIAGTAFLEKKDSYRGIGGTGVGVRLLFDFIKNKQ